MLETTKPIEIKILKDMGQYKAGDLIRVTADEDGVPLDQFWRRRLKDSKDDSCCEIVMPAAKQNIVQKKTEIVTEENE
jgi:hypothetical protein